MNFNWTCPFCNHKSVVTDDNYSQELFSFPGGKKYGQQSTVTAVIRCPNVECQEYVLSVHLYDQTGSAYSYVNKQPAKQVWRLIPTSSARPFPDYVPEPIRADYEEACLIKDLSPKASATLARRCLQGMIRDFWKVKSGNLAGEIKAIEDKVDFETWKAIEAVRNVGNIGAHMEKDINLVIDVEPDEAALLVGLIETLIEEWYVHRHQRQERMKKVADLAATKKTEKKALPAPVDAFLDAAPDKTLLG